MDTTIILPVYNGATRIARAIKSVQSQTCTQWQLLVIDDGSTDNTAAVVQDFCISDTRILYYKNEKNLGIQKTLNRGLELAKGEYIARIDDDDEWCDVTKLQQQIDFLTARPDYVLVGTGAIVCDSGGAELYRYITPQTDKHIRHAILGKNCFVHSSVVFRRVLALSLGGYSESKDVLHIEDYHLWLRMGLMGKLANLPVCAVKLYQRNTSISALNRQQQYKKNILVSYMFRKKYNNALGGLLLGVVRYCASFVIDLFPKKIIHALIVGYKK